MFEIPHLTKIVLEVTLGQNFKGMGVPKIHTDIHRDSQRHLPASLAA